MPYQALLPVVSEDVLSGGAGLYGILLGCAGVGALAGAIGLLLRKGLAGLGRRVAFGATLLGAGLRPRRSPAIPSSLGSRSASRGSGSSRRWPGR